jgi:hypothetical protein
MFAEDRSPPRAKSQKLKLTLLTSYWRPSSAFGVDIQRLELRLVSLLIETQVAHASVPYRTRKLKPNTISRLDTRELNLSSIHLVFARLPIGMIFNNVRWPQIRVEIRWNCFLGGVK